TNLATAAPVWGGLWGGEEAIEPPHTFLKVVTRGDVVAVEHRAGPMPEKRHRHALRDSAPDEIPRSRTSQVMRPQRRQAGGLDCPQPVALERRGGASRKHRRNDAVFLPLEGRDSVALAL